MKKFLLSLMGLVCSMGMWAGNFPTGKTWDFTNLQVSDFPDIDKTGESWGDASWIYWSGFNCILNGNYTKGTNEPLYADDEKTTPATWATGLVFSFTNQNQLRVYVEGYTGTLTFKGICSTSGGASITIPGLVKDQEVSISYSKCYDPNPGTPTIDNVTGEEIPATTDAVQTYKAKVTADGNVKITGIKYLITKIEVSKETTTAINTVSTSSNNGVAYNVAGQRVNANAKGMVIINGKKYMNK